MAKHAKQHPTTCRSKIDERRRSQLPKTDERQRSHLLKTKKPTSVVTCRTSRMKPADPTARTASTSRKKAADSTARTSTWNRKSSEPAVQPARKRKKTRPLTTDDIPTIVRVIKDAFLETSSNPEDTQATEDTVSDVSDHFGMYPLLLLSVYVCLLIILPQHADKLLLSPH